MFSQVSQSSGRMLLVDATGSIDVIIPDLPSSMNINNIYEVSCNINLLSFGVSFPNHLGAQHYKCYVADIVSSAKYFHFSSP